VRVNTAILCDFAEVRENLLFIMAGGITRLWRAEWPGAMNVCLALVVELEHGDRERPHELDVQIIDADGALQARIQGGFQQAAGPDTDIHETTFFPFVFDLRPVGLPHAGWYTIMINLDGEGDRLLGVKAEVRPDAPG
jgi:hypothetical protein